MTKHLTLEQEVGFRSGFTEKEREFSQHAIQRQIENENRFNNTNRSNDFEEEDEEEDDGKFDLESHFCSTLTNWKGQEK